MRQPLAARISYPTPASSTPRPERTADHSLPYVIAAAVADGNVLPASFTEEKLWDPRIRTLLAKIKVVADPEIDALFPGVKRARVRITTTSGEQHSAQVDHAKGSPQNPLSDEDIIAKFRANASGVISTNRQIALIEATWGFDELKDLGKYMRLLTADVD